MRLSSGLELYNTELMEVIELCWEWEKGIVDHPKFHSMLIISGPVGCGKTTICRRLFRGLQRELLCENEWTTGPDLCTAAGACDERLLEDCQNTRLLGIDDLGAEVDQFGRFAGRLGTLLSTRERRPTIITTNVPSSKWGSRWDERVQDRMLRNSLIFEFKATRSYTMHIAESGQVTRHNQK